MTLLTVDTERRREWLTVDGARMAEGQPKKGYMMKIGPLHQPRAIVEGQPAQPAPTGQPEKKAAPRSDSVEISDNARERLSQLADEARHRVESDDPASPTAATESNTDLREDKIRLARARVRSGYYNQPEVKQDIAAKLADKLTETPPENPETPA